MAARAATLCPARLAVGATARRRYSAMSAPWALKTRYQSTGRRTPTRAKTVPAPATSDGTTRVRPTWPVADASAQVRSSCTPDERTAARNAIPEHWKTGHGRPCLSPSVGYELRLGRSTRCRDRQRGGALRSSAGPKDHASAPHPHIRRCHRAPVRL